MFGTVVILLTSCSLFVNVYGSNTLCDSKIECKDWNITTSSVECTAERSCASSHISSQNVTCSGSKSCQYSVLSNVIDGECESTKSCRRQLKSIKFEKTLT